MLLPVPIIFAYLELGGNWYGYKLLSEDKNKLMYLIGTIIFSVLYSLVAAFVAIKFFNINIGKLMVNYGFGFSAIATFLVLEWGKLPSLSWDIFRSSPTLYGTLLIIELIGFLLSGYLVVTDKGSA